MRRPTGLFTRSLLLISTVTFTSLLHAAVISNQQSRRNIQELYANLPLAFEPNHGQTDQQVKFLARGNRYIVFLTANEAVLRLKDRTALTVGADSAVVEAVLRIKLAGANPNAVISGSNLLPAISNYLDMKDRRAWLTNIPNYAAVDYKRVLPGIDLRYYGNRQELEYDIVVAPHSDSKKLLLQFEGADQLRVDERGDLIIQTAAGELRQSRPYAYQVENGIRQEIATKYIIQDRRHVRIQVGTYDPGRELVIDPVLRYSTYLGGATTIDPETGENRPAITTAADIFVNAFGQAYVVGDTHATDFPTTSGAFRRSAEESCARGSGCFPDDGFVTKFNSTGSGLVYSTYLRGGNLPSLTALAVDSNGNAYIASNTEEGGSEARRWPVIMKLNATGSALLYRFELGPGFCCDVYTFATDIKVDSAGNAYVTGSTTDTGLPVTAGAYDTTLDGFSDAFVLKLDTNKTGNDSIVYLTYLGGSNGESGGGITLDGSGNAYVTGTTESTDFPMTSSFGSGGGRGFVTKVNPTGSGLVYSAIIRGAVPNAITLDSSRNAYVTGFARAIGFPRTSGAFQTAYGGGESDAFVLKLSPGARALLYSTYLGGDDRDDGEGIAVDSSGRAYVAGDTASTNFPVTSNAIQKTRMSSGTEFPFDGFVTVLNPSGSGLSFYSTYLGGSSGTTIATSIAIDRALNAYVTGATTSPNFRTTSGAFQTTLQGSESAFISKIVIAADLALTKTASSSTVNRGSNLTYTLKVLNKGPDRSDAPVLTDAVPSGTTFVKFTTSAGSCTAPAVGTRGTLTCKRTSLSKGSTWTVTMTVKVNASSGPTITNTARVTAKTQDLVSSNNSASNSTKVN
jgi:uncharacterized repeat protein (TIGR01451 family)